MLFNVLMGHQEVTGSRPLLLYEVTGSRPHACVHGLHTGREMYAMDEF